MSLPALDNLVRIGQLKSEPRNELEVKRMLAMARSRLDTAHQKRNLAEYEGYLEVEESTIKELCTLVPSLIADVTALMDR